MVWITNFHYSEAVHMFVIFLTIYIIPNVLL
jgi:hypothetical protein